MQTERHRQTDRRPVLLYRHSSLGTWFTELQCWIFRQCRRRSGSDKKQSEAVDDGSRSRLRRTGDTLQLYTNSQR